MNREKRKIFKTHRVGVRESRELKKSQVWQRKPFLGKVRGEEFCGMLALGWPSLMPKALRSSVGRVGFGDGVGRPELEGEAGFRFLSAVPRQLWSGGDAAGFSNAISSVLCSWLHV